MNFREKLTETLAHWHRLHPWKQHSTLLFLGVFILSFPLQHYWQQRAHMTHMEQQLQTQRESLAHQQKLLATLKEKAATQLLTPALADKSTNPTTCSTFANRTKPVGFSSKALTQATTSRPFQRFTFIFDRTFKREHRIGTRGMASAAKQ